MSEVYLPKPYKVFVANHPNVAEAYQKLGEACHEAGPLDEKTRHLIKLGSRRLFVPREASNLKRGAPSTPERTSKRSDTP